MLTKCIQTLFVLVQYRLINYLHRFYTAITFLDYTYLYLICILIIYFTYTLVCVSYLFRSYLMSRTCILIIYLIYLHAIIVYIYPLFTLHLYLRVTYFNPNSYLYVMYMCLYDVFRNDFSILQLIFYDKFTPQFQLK